MGKKQAKAFHKWLGARFGNQSRPGDATGAARSGVTYLGSGASAASTIVGNYRGYFGQFQLTARGGIDHRVGLHCTRANEGARHVVFRLDDRPGPTLEILVEKGTVGRVQGGWRITHRKHAALGSGGSIGFGDVRAAVESEAPWLLTGDRIDLGVILEDDGDPVAAIAGFLHRALAYILIRERLRAARLAR